MLWIPITLLAALAQTLRFMFQKRLRIATLSTGGATFARFLYAAPLIALVAVGYAAARGYGMPVMDWQFWAFAAAGGILPNLRHHVRGGPVSAAQFHHRHYVQES